MVGLRILAWGCVDIMRLFQETITATAFSSTQASFFIYLISLVALGLIIKFQRTVVLLVRFLRKLKKMSSLETTLKLLFLQLCFFVRQLRAPNYCFSQTIPVRELIKRKKNSVWHYFISQKIKQN